VVVGRHDLRFGTDGERIGRRRHLPASRLRRRHAGQRHRPAAPATPARRRPASPSPWAPPPMRPFRAGRPGHGDRLGRHFGNPPELPTTRHPCGKCRCPSSPTPTAPRPTAATSSFPIRSALGIWSTGASTPAMGQRRPPVRGGCRRLPPRGHRLDGQRLRPARVPGIYTAPPPMSTGSTRSWPANPLPACEGRAATLLGSGWARHAEPGPSGDDVIVARSGHDTIYGEAGADLICTARATTGSTPAAATTW